MEITKSTRLQTTEAVYSDYFKIQKQIVNLTRVNRYEYINIIIRFLLNLANARVALSQQPDSQIYNSLIFYRVTEDDPAFKKMKEELYEKRIPDVSNTILKMINIPTIKLHKNPVIQSDEITGHITMQFNNTKITLPIPPRFIGSSYDQHDLAIMLLAYDNITLGQNSQQWRLSDDMYDLLYDKYGARLECFASPINSCMMGRKDGKFCSLFGSTVDKPFGSVGDFFQYQKQSSDLPVVACNPPYVPDIMEKCCGLFQKLTGVLTLPYWKDFQPIVDLISASQNNDTLHYIIFKKREHSYFDGESRKQLAYFDSIMFINNLKSDDNRFSDIRAAFR